MAIQDDYIKTALRLPKHLHLKLQESADATSKSMNAEIIARLEESFAGGDRSSMVAAIARLTAGLALANSNKLNEQLRVTVLATYIRQFAEILFPMIGSSNPQLKADLDAAVREANEFFHSPQALKKQAAEQSVAMRKALEQMQRLGGVERTDPELSTVLDTVERLGESDALDSDVLEPPVMPARSNERKVNVKGPEQRATSKAAKKNA